MEWMLIFGVIIWMFWGAWKCLFRALFGLDSNDKDLIDDEI